MKIDINMLNNWDYNLPYIVWYEIKCHTVWAIQAAKEHDSSNMTEHIIRAETAISIYNITVNFYLDENASESARLTGYARITELIEAIYRRYKPFT